MKYDNDRALELKCIGSNNHISDNTKAILLLTAPLLVGKGKVDVNPLTLTEYNKLVGHRYRNDVWGCMVD